MVVPVKRREVLAIAERSWPGCVRQFGQARRRRVSVCEALPEVLAATRQTPVIPAWQAPPTTICNASEGVSEQHWGPKGISFAGTVSTAISIAIYVHLFRLSCCHLESLLSQRTSQCTRLPSQPAPNGGEQHHNRASSPSITHFCS